MPDLKPAEVIRFLLIVRVISVAVVINWVRKPIGWEFCVELEPTGNMVRPGGGNDDGGDGGNSIWECCWFPCPHFSYNASKINCAALFFLRLCKCHAVHFLFRWL